MTRPSPNPRERVAIVGLGGIFPDSPDIETFWTNVRDGHAASRVVPPGRWLLKTEDAYDPGIAVADHVYSTRGCFVEGFVLDPEGLALEPATLDRLDPMFHLALHAARSAWRDARTETVDRSRVGVVFGNIVLPTEAASRVARDTLGRTFEEAMGLTSDPVEPFEPLNTRVAGLPAGLVARALGLGGGSYTIDAACASSLYALKLASDELLEGRADAMITGGLSRPDPLYTQMGFSQLRALSPTGTASPFGASADGLVVGEGAGMFVLKRLSDARRQGDTIYAVIAGAGLSNDVDGGLLAPTSEGQLRAMRTAYDQAGWRPEDVDLIECHATGTPVGDAVEFASLRTLWADAATNPDRCVIGSVKSNVGHALTAAGAAGLLKVLLALKSRTLPPTAGYDQPAESLKIDDSPFRILSRSEPWPLRQAGQPRRVALSGFGFGGINAHVLIEEESAGEAWTREVESNPVEPVAIVGLSAHFGTLDHAKAFQRAVLGSLDHRPHPYRPERWWGVAESHWFAAGPFSRRMFAGNRIDEFALSTDRFRIPPREIEEMLPQQSLLLRLAGEAIEDAGWPRLDHPTRLRTGAIIGLGLDLNTTNFHVRWSLLDKARGWNDRLGLGLNPEELNEWVTDLRDSFGPPLNANRTMGALGSIVASRVAREYRLGGPSFTVSSEETSGLRAIDVAVRMLGRRELDQAIVGAVDFTGDPRTSIAERHLNPGRILTDGAAVMVLKRLGDAERDGDKIYAVIRGLGVSTNLEPSQTARLALESAGVNAASVSLVDSIAHETLAPLWPVTARIALGSTEAVVGHAGAASGLASLLKTLFCLDQQILPAFTTRQEPFAPFYGPRGPQFWLRDREAGPRRALVGSTAVDGNAIVVVIEGHEPTASVSNLDRFKPLGDVPAGLFVVSADDPSGLLVGLDALVKMAQESGQTGMDDLAGQWWRRHADAPPARLAVALVAEDRTKLINRVAVARKLVNGEEVPARRRPSDRLAYASQPLGPGASLAFVFPGMGNHFAAMGRELSCRWPEILRHQDSAHGCLKSQMASGTYWNDDPPSDFVDHRASIFGQVSFGTMAADLLRHFGVKPDVALGYSLGETTALFALEAWTDRDLMYRRFDASTLFRTDLAGPCDAARLVWNMPEDEAVDWSAGIILKSSADVLEALRGIDRAYLLIVNTDDQVVVGGQKQALDRLVERLKTRLLPLPLVSTVHCEIVRAVESSYHDLHLLPTQAPADIRFASGATGEFLELTAESAAGSIVAHALHGLDFPKVVRQAYAEGVRGFVEVGPGGSCSRMINEILQGEPHFASAACPDDPDPVSAFLMLLGRLIAERFPVDLAPLYRRQETRPIETAGRTLKVEVGGRPFQPPAIPRSSRRRNAPLVPSPPIDRGPMPMPMPMPRQPAPFDFAIATAPPSDPLLAQVFATGFARGQAHQSFLNLSGGISTLMAGQVAFQMDLIERLSGGDSLEPGHHPGNGFSLDITPPRNPHREIPPRSLDRAACLEFAVGSIGDVLGPDFAAIDSHPTRVRLPDEPLMLVDRILSIEGEPRSMKAGRVVTEHDVLPGAWYLDSGRIPTCIAVEAGQADLFLSAFLGIDFETKGLAVYRLLDARVTFHGDLPRVGQVIHYDIAIDSFFRQGDSRLFRFRFEATVDGQPLMSMSEGIAGFFTSDALEAGQGVVKTALDLRQAPGIRPEDWSPLVPMTVQGLDDRQVEALRGGDLVAAFGSSFAGLDVEHAAPLPGGLMRLVDRVLKIEPEGGRHGLGRIVAEANIRPEDWFMTCHFVDDRVMPGTLMYECCLHTLRIFLMRMGWIGEAGQVACQPVQGVSSKLKCRGQVLESTQKVTYDVAIKEIGYGPEPYAIVDALMLADGKPIVEITDMSLRMSGLDRPGLERLWSERATTNKPLYDAASILAFATGKPSEAFGEPYNIFDEGRMIARLPGPPYQFLDRVVAVQGPPWKMAAGAQAVAEYDVPLDAWYFQADRQEVMPFAVLLETALQPCGWLAAYMGSALTSPTDLSFRNLGGSARQLALVGRDIGTLRTTATTTKVSQSGGMIIQQYDFVMTADSVPIYQGETTFGFFSKAALADQVGIRDAMPYAPTTAELARAQAFDYPTSEPFPDERWRMIDRVEELSLDGGPHGLGFARGSMRVDPSRWFFAAHFYQDPVVPGSLGLESFQQLLKVMACQRWGLGRSTKFESPGLNDLHRWTYRGQILPVDRRVTTRVVVSEVDDARGWIKADGYLDVDGRLIYRMNDFTLKAESNAR